jgi:hypothetical protein
MTASYARLDCPVPENIPRKSSGKKAECRAGETAKRLLENRVPNRPLPALRATLSRKRERGLF